LAVSRSFLRFFAGALFYTAGIALLLEPKQRFSGLALLLPAASGLIVGSRKSTQPDKAARNLTDREVVAIMVSLVAVPLSLWLLFRLLESGTVSLPVIPEPPHWVYRTLMVIVWLLGLRSLWRRSITPGTTGAA